MNNGGLKLSKFQVSPFYNSAVDRHYIIKKQDEPIVLKLQFPD